MSSKQPPPSSSSLPRQHSPVERYPAPPPPTQTSTRTHSRSPSPASKRMRPNSVETIEPRAASSNGQVSPSSNSYHRRDNEAPTFTVAPAVRTDNATNEKQNDDDVSTNSSAQPPTSSSPPAAISQPPPATSIPTGVD